MSGRGPRWMPYPIKEKLNVTISGYLSRDRGTVTINGETFYDDLPFYPAEEVQLKVEKSTEVAITVAGSKATVEGRCMITIDDVIVQHGAGTYTYVAEKNLNIVFARVSTGNGVAWTCVVTTS